MGRRYFNGINSVVYNGKFLSFVLDDTYEARKGSPNKSTTVELITDLEAAEGVCKYLLSEIDKIKQSALKEPPLERLPSKENVSEPKKDKPSIRSTIGVSSSSHQD